MHVSFTKPPTAVTSAREEKRVRQGEREQARIRTARTQAGTKTEPTFTNRY
jgi:hypothetical protein